ncbi:Mammalian cell entry related domain protein [Streptomyces albus]|uniref:Mammalian cell entry related domain protein n=1 Tax=Streptomyces albus (strain ATCC 21838 / DSM 41398 / FERM P-419 / JCM 4703 / NBRC 107858) TaxID=1081613 RepID=A0A0B5F6P1_STRA4|nr:Mammalian cell entry related domain protein [Streptomyces albus]AOU81558.1 Mammalian cell entry related domain protein [Streptomyces albus]AYN37251.1 MCE family protein [Streptomyces albus]
MRRFLTSFLVLALVIGAGAVWLWPEGDKYQVAVQLGSADNLVEGGWVTVNGNRAGKVEDIAVHEGKAMVKLSLRGRNAPLHDGAKVTVEWNALLGERWIEIKDGPRANARVPSGGMLPGAQATPMNLDDVLNALDAPTRKRLTSLVKQLDGTLEDNQADTRDTLLASGPALQSLGEVLSAVGKDGPSLRSLVTQLNSTVSILSKRDKDVRTVVDDLSKTTKVTVKQRKQLIKTLKKLPGTLDTTKKTLDDVPGVKEKTVPLLKDLRPATRQLPSVSRNLAPVLRNLNPLVDRLGPTLTSADALLRYTPGLLDTAHGTVPGVTSATKYLEPALNYLRPYTPELAGWLSEWSGNGANYDGNGHFVRFQLQQGATEFSDNPGVVPPGSVYEPYPLPGANVNQPWTDAWGGGAK